MPSRPPSPPAAHPPLENPSFPLPPDDGHATSPLIASPEYTHSPVSPIPNAEAPHTAGSLPAPRAAVQDVLPPQILTADALREPPPPYPHQSSPNSRRRRARRTLNTSAVSDVPHPDGQPFPVSPGAGDDQPASPRLLGPPGQGIGGTSPRETFRRRRTMSGSETVRSRASVASAAPSLARTVASLFADDWSGDEDDCPGLGHSPRPGAASTGARGQARDANHSPRLGDESEAEGTDESDGRERRGTFGRRWRRYWRPLGRRAYWAALFHLLFLNLPWAIIAWVYLFVFTLLGTALLITLPLGAVLCFFDLLGARALSRGELALQTSFHGPLALYPDPPNPIFTYPRPTPVTDEEAPLLGGRQTVVYETSFYRNTYSMFTDSTSYRALFYFLVIKPSITLLLTVLLVVFVPVALALVLPAPGMLRAVRKLGVWQANVAVEGLWIGVL